MCCALKQFITQTWTTVLAKWQANFVSLAKELKIDSCNLLVFVWYKHFADYIIPAGM